MGLELLDLPEEDIVQRKMKLIRKLLEYIEISNTEERLPVPEFRDYSEAEVYNSQRDHPCRPPHQRHAAFPPQPPHSKM